jgi:hypothetical protein
VDDTLLIFKKERQRIRQFLEQSGGRYKKLIIDIRDNGGGTPEYLPKPGMPLP